MIRIFYFGLFILTVLSCNPKHSKKNEDVRAAEHVIIIGIDAWGSYTENKADIPHITQMINEGAYTYEKRAVLPSVSAANWASMYMGAPPEIHGYTDWNSSTPDIPPTELTENGIFPTLFHLVRKSIPEAELGCAYEWEGIKHLVDTLSLDFFYGGIDYGQHPTELTKISIDYIKNKRPNLFGIFYDQLDATGHRAGHDTPEYYQNLHEIDQYIGKIVQATKDAGIYENTTFIITADHGGIDKGHGGKTLEELRTPFIVSGKYANKGMRYDGPMMQYDVAPTVAYLFNLQIPESWYGKQHTNFYSFQ